MFALSKALSVFGIILASAVTPASSQTIVNIDGSTGAMPLVAALAKAYEARTADVALKIGGGLGTKARIEALRAGTIDIAVASHGLKIDDLTAQGISVDPIARTPVVFAVNSSVAVTNLTEAQVCSIYSGVIGNWKELGGNDLAIAPHTRPDSEVDAEVMRAGIPCLKSLTMPATVRIMERGGDMARALAATPGAIGMSTTTVADQSGGKIKVLSLDGTTPTELNVTAGRYRLVREVFLLVTANASPAARSFLQFVKSSEGAKVIKANAAIPKFGG